MDQHDSLCGNYGNIAGPLTRKYSTFAIDPGVNFLPNQNLAEDYGVRTIAEIDRETQKIDLTMYRVTDAGICDALLRALKRGVPVRLLTEPHEYRFANRSGAGVCSVQHRPAVRGRSADPDAQASWLNHQKTVSLYGAELTIFGSSNWSWQSFNFQEEHNYYTTKDWFFQWFVNQFERKWNSATEYEAFVPLPPSAPVNLAPGNGVTAGTSVMLTWEGGNWAHKYDVYWGRTRVV